MKRAVLYVALATAAAVAVVLALRPSRHAAAQRRPVPQAVAPRLLLGVDDDALKWTTRPLAVVRRQRSVGARAVRVWVPWHGQASPGPVRRTELARAERAALHTEVVLAVFGFAREAPVSPDAQARFCGYVRDALGLVPAARAVVVWNEANSPTYWRASPAAYERLLARCYDDLHALRPGITMLDSTASAHAPAAFLSALGAAYRASARTAPLVDAFGHNPYPRTSREEPSARHAGDFLGEGDYPRLVDVLARAFGGTAQRSRAVWYLEDGFQTGAPARLTAAYRGRETAPTVGAAVQAARVRSAILLAACQPRVRAFFNFELVDERRLSGWQSGLFRPGWLPKPAAEAFADAAAVVRSGDVDCGSAAGGRSARP
jgi:hypothetical protein